MAGALPSLQFPLNQSHCNTVTITCILIVTSLTQPVRDTVAAALQDTPWLRCALRFCEHWLVGAAAAAAMQCSRDVQTASGEGDGSSSYWVAVNASRFENTTENCLCLVRNEGWNTASLVLLCKAHSVVIELAR